jgi:hypothetical protein
MELSTITEVPAYFGAWMRHRKIAFCEEKLKLRVS